jgi:hypothetical protein
MHWYLHEEHGRGASAETTCDRFALANYRRRSVTREDAAAALRRAVEPGRTGSPVAARRSI